MCAYIHFLALFAERDTPPPRLPPESMTIPTAVSNEGNQGSLEKLLMPENRDVLKNDRAMSKEPRCQLVETPMAKLGSNIINNNSNELYP